jgi:hypothetical protein
MSESLSSVTKNDSHFVFCAQHSNVRNEKWKTYSQIHWQFPDAFRNGVAVHPQIFQLRETAIESVDKSRQSPIGDKQLIATKRVEIAYCNVANFVPGPCGRSPVSANAGKQKITFLSSPERPAQLPQKRWRKVGPLQIRLCQKKSYIDGETEVMKRKYLRIAKNSFWIC